MEILVTGYRGFISQNICSELRNRGHIVTGYEWG